LGVIAIVAIVIIALMFLFIIPPDEEGNGDGGTTITPAVAMAWTEDDESPGDFIGNVVDISTADADIDDINIFISYDGATGSIDLDDLAGSNDLEIGGLVLDYGDINSNSKLDAQDVFLITGASSDVTIKMKYSPTGGQMYYGTIFVSDYTPRGALYFTEDPSVIGNWSGGVMGLSDEVKLADCQITILDSSTNTAASQGPPIISEQPISTGSEGLTLNFSDINSDSNIDEGDVWRISNGEAGDEVRWIYKNGNMIASYTLS
jgi:hypothetical protein